LIIFIKLYLIVRLFNIFILWKSLCLKLVNCLWLIIRNQFLTLLHKSRFFFKFFSIKEPKLAFRSSAPRFIRLIYLSSVRNRHLTLPIGLKFNEFLLLERSSHLKIFMTKRFQANPFHYSLNQFLSGFLIDFQKLS